MRHLLSSVVATALLLGPLACDFEKTGNQIAAKKVMVGTLLSTPSVQVSPWAMAGLDAGTPLDGGPGSETFTVPGQTVAYVFFGTREGEQNTLQPLQEASVRLEIQGITNPVVLQSEGPGIHGRTSGNDTDGGLPYRSGASYRFIAVHGGYSHVGKVEAAPTLERLDGLHPPEGFVRHTAGQSLTLTRPALASGATQHNIGLVTVFPLRANGERGEPTYTNVPRTPLAFLELVATQANWRSRTVLLPGSAFPQPESTYLVVFQTTQPGGPESDNLFIGSAVLVGTADVGVVYTR
jgi:hypothetical protein